MGRANAGLHVLLGSFDRSASTGLHALIQSSRSGDPVAVHAVLERVRQVAGLPWPWLRPAVLVLIPSHLPNSTQPFLEAVAETLVALRGWQLATDGLVRIDRGPEAKSSRSRDPAVEASTLEWRHACPAAPAIVLLDDVYRTGATIEAARQAIARSGDSRPVLALVVAAAIDGPSTM
jgi:hypothetical protein